MLVLWHALALRHAGSFVIAGPADILRYAADHPALLLRAGAATLHGAAWGYLWGNLAACALAVVVVLVPRAERAVMVLALVVFCLPLVATGPILRILFGPGSGPQITLAALAVYYTSFLALLIGLRAVPQIWTDLVDSYGGGRLRTLIHVRARASLPYAVAALQISAPVAILGAMVGEFTGAERGLGVLTLRAMSSLDVAATWTVATLATALSVAVYLAVGGLGRRLTPERPPLLIAAAPATPPATGPGARWRAVASGAALLVGILAAWSLAMDAFDLNRFFAKRPADLWHFLVADPGAGEARVTLAAAFAQTLALSLPGYAAGLALGVGLAVLLVLLPRLAGPLLPVAIAMRSVPIIATAPLLVLALGRGALGTSTIVAVMIFFPTFVACAEGLRQVPGPIVDLFHSYAAGRGRLLLWARLPAMLPAFFAAARMAVPAAILAVTTTEWLATGRGIGNLMAMTASTSNYNMLWSCVVLLCGAAMAGYLAIEAIERRVLAVFASEQLRR